MFNVVTGFPCGNICKGGRYLKKNRTTSAIKWIAVRFPELIAAVSLTVAITITVVNAFTRYLLKYTFAGSDEIVCIAFAWMVFPGAAAAFRRKMHYGIDLLVNALPVKLQTGINLLVKIAITVILACVTWLSILLVGNVGSKIMTATRISYRVLDSSLIVGFGLMTIYSTIFLVQELKEFPAKMKEKRGEAK